MAHSPYLSKELKEYISQNKIEEKVNKAVNEMLRQQPEDPFGSLVNLLGEECSQKVSLAKIQAFEVLNNEYRPTIRLLCSFRYKMSIQGGFTETYSLVDETNPQVLYDQDAPDRFEGKGMKKACDLTNQKALSVFSDIDCNDSKKVDDALKAFSAENQGATLNITLPLSIISHKAIATLLKVPLYKRLNEAYLATDGFEASIPQVFICILQGSKSVGSKCKPARFHYILPQDRSGIEKATLAKSLALGVRKSIASGKLGENGVKQLPDGSFVCPFDTINDNLKMLDDVINQNGVKDVVKIGIEWAADNLFQPSQNKYELENPNPKNFLDTAQLIDFYLKLCTDRPSIAYMEDPLVADQPDAWVLLRNKFQGKNVKFGSRKLYNTLENAQKVLELVKAGDSGLTQEQAAQANEKRVQLDYAVLRYGDYLSIGAYYQLASYIKRQSPSSNLIVQDNYFETEDSFVVDLAASSNGAAILVGPPIKSERLAKFNRIIELDQLIAKE